MPVIRNGREEVVNGEIRIMPPNKWNHASIVGNVRRALEAWLDRREFLVVVEDFGLIIRKAPLTSRNPDLAVFRKSTIVERDGYIHSAPQLIAEVLSPRNRLRDREELRRDYSSIGVPEYWVITPEERTVEVFYLEDGQLRTAALRAEGMLEPREFPGVRVDMAGMWAD